LSGPWIAPSPTTRSCRSSSTRCRNCSSAMPGAPRTPP
jgi:hypothetical protein